MPLLHQKCGDHTVSLSMFSVLARLMSKGASSRMRIVLESNAWCRPSEKQAKQSRDIMQISAVLCECVSDGRQRQARLWNVGSMSGDLQIEDITGAKTQALVSPRE